MRKIEKIDVIKPILKSKKKVAAYARVSVETDRLKHSLSNQVSYYNQFIQSNPEWEFVGVYADSGISGTSASKRPEFQRLLQDCRDGKIDIVLTKSIQRFARNTVDLLEVVRELKTLGIEVRFEKENIHSLSGDGELMLSILASFAQEESRSISENVKWGTIKRFKQGIPNGRFHIYGYRWEGDKLVIIEEEAKVIRRIYSEYLSGKSRLQIEKMFATEGIKTRRGYPWVDSNIRVILMNIHYTGNLLFQKEYVADPISKKLKKNRGELPQYFVEDTHEAIISMEDYQKVQAEMKRRRKGGAKLNPSIPTTELTGKIHCPCCSKNFHSAVRNQRQGKVKMWICANRKSGKRAMCQTGEMQDALIKEEIMAVLGLTKWDVSAVETQLKGIDVIRKEKWIFTLHDGTQIERPYRQKDRTAYYTQEIREQISHIRRDKHRQKWKHRATPFTGLIECGCCGNSFKSAKNTRKNGEVEVYLSCGSKRSVCPKNSIKEHTLKKIICEKLNLDVFDEDTMDAQVERIFIKNNQVTIKLKNGDKIVQSYQEKRPFVPWSQERREQQKANPQKWTEERRKQQSEAMKRIRREKKW